MLLATAVIWFAIALQGCANTDCVAQDLTCNPGWIALRSFGVSTPTFNPPAAFYSSAQNISITTSTPGATIYFTGDGSAPTPSSEAFISAFPIWSAAGRTINAYALKEGIRDSEVLSGRLSYHTLRTGQTASFAAGDDASATQGVSISHTGPTQHSVYTNDYTTLDNSTGLVWKSCSEGQSGPACATGAVAAASLAVGTASCAALNSLNSGKGYAGTARWRLPTMKELQTLTNFSLAALTLYTASLPGTANFAYWSSTPYPPNAGFGWYVDYSNANSYATTFGNPYHARCVSAAAMAESNSYSDNGDGTIKDNVTGLTWQKCSQGQANDTSCTGAASAAASWNAALTYCNSLSLASRTWRLPNRNEYSSIYDFTIAAGATINLTYFPNTAAAFYWTSTTNAAPTTSAWYINFGTGFNALSDVQAKANATTNVRCVAGP